MIDCKGEVVVNIEIAGKTVKVPCIVVYKMVPDVDVIIGTDVLRHFQCSFHFGQFSVSAAVRSSLPNLSIKKNNFEINFNGEKWVAKWLWKKPPALKNRVDAYKMSDNICMKFKSEVKRWINNGWLVKIPEHKNGVIPLMAVVQEKKNKVRPVLDFRELNEFVECSGADADVCGEKLRAWRQKSKNCALLDLRDAYMQVGVDSQCSKYQTIKFEGSFYELRRLGFGLNCAPEIMKAVVSKVLSLDEEIRAGTDHYYDDIIVDLDIVSVEKVKSHLVKFGLVTKPCEKLGETKVLGLHTYKNNETVCWKRTESKNDLDPPKNDVLTKRQVFSLCGKWVGHYPVAGWLRVAASFIKRSCEGTAWDDFAGNVAIDRLREVSARLENDDPVKGVWSVPNHGHFKVWCDASKIAYGVVLEKENTIIEDGSWLRKEDDCTHINLAELNAVVRGVNMAMKWSAKDLTVVTDSAAVHSWLSSMLKKDKRIRVSGLSEMLVKRRLSIVLKTLEEYEVKWNVWLIPSTKNLADILTRVPKRWFCDKPCSVVALSGSCSDNCEILKGTHSLHHCGVDTTLHFAKRVNPAITRKEAEDIVRACVECQSIDPCAKRIECGKLEVCSNWQRIAIDVTHFGQLKYLTIIDCGPSRFAIWRSIRTETDSEVVGLLEQVFAEHGPPEEILCDNGKAFTSKLMDNFCKDWCVKLTFRCAYRPSGNGVIERNHRTIKRMVARTKRSIQHCVFWYNMTPHGDQNIIPCHSIAVGKWRNPFLDGSSEASNHSSTWESCEFAVGEKVWVKPPGARCTSSWSLGLVTNINSKHNVSVNGVPRHVYDVRKVHTDTTRELNLRTVHNDAEGGVAGIQPATEVLSRADENSASASLSGSDVEDESDEEMDDERLGLNNIDGVRRSMRQRRVPTNLDDYVLDDDYVF